MDGWIDGYMHNFFFVFLFIPLARHHPTLNPFILNHTPVHSAEPPPRPRNRAFVGGALVFSRRLAGRRLCRQYLEVHG